MEQPIGYMVWEPPELRKPPTFPGETRLMTAINHIYIIPPNTISEGWADWRKQGIRLLRRLRGRACRSGNCDRARVIRAAEYLLNGVSRYLDDSGKKSFRLLRRICPPEHRPSLVYGLSGLVRVERLVPVFSARDLAPALSSRNAQVREWAMRAIGELEACGGPAGRDRDRRESA